jgi:hypothetical protein
MERINIIIKENLKEFIKNITEHYTALTIRFEDGSMYGNGQYINESIERVNLILADPHVRSILNQLTEVTKSNSFYKTLLSTLAIDLSIFKTLQKKDLDRMNKNMNKVKQAIIQIDEAFTSEVVEFHQRSSKSQLIASIIDSLGLIAHAKLLCEETSDDTFSIDDYLDTELRQTTNDYEFTEIPMFKKYSKLSSHVAYSTKTKNTLKGKKKIYQDFCIRELCELFKDHYLPYQASCNIICDTLSIKFQLEFDSPEYIVTNEQFDNIYYYNKDSKNLKKP